MTLKLPVCAYSAVLDIISFILQVQETSRGEVEIQLTLSTDQKTIKGTLLQANNLCKMDFLGSSGMLHVHTTAQWSSI